MRVGAWRDRSSRRDASRRLIALLGLAMSLLLCRRAHAEEPRAALGLSNLVARVEDEIGFARPEYRVHILEALRAAGFNAVGAESLVFAKDDAARADLLLGGTVQELACQPVGKLTNCRIGVAWEVLDRETDRVVYGVFTRHMEAGLPRNNQSTTGKRLILGALGSLTKRLRFIELANRPSKLPPADATYRGEPFRACPLAQRRLPDDFNDAAEATVIVKDTRGFGSGFFLGPDGLVLTAAHVVENGSVKVQRRSGETLQARIVRVSRRHDVALLAVEAAPSTTFPCLALAHAPERPGGEVYALGAPASQDLAFSLTRGIISGLRSIKGLRLIQTDASLSPGNSGGPLLDSSAAVTGVVSRKIAAEAVEGIGFAVPIEDALSALKLEASFETSAALLRTSTPHTPVAAAPIAIQDIEDPLPSLDPIGDARRRRWADWQASRPRYIGPLRMIGVTATIVGGIGVTASWAAYKLDGPDTAEHYNSARLQNDIAWGVTLLGTAALVASYVLDPDPPNEEQAKHPRRRTIVAGPGAAGVGLRF